MEIRSLTLVATEADLNELAPKIFSWPDAIRDLRISIIPEGIRASGTYQQLFGIRFQTLWRVSVSEGRVVARLEELKAGSSLWKFQADRPSCTGSGKFSIFGGSVKFSASVFSF